MPIDPRRQAIEDQELRQMDMGWQYVGEAVERERGLVRKDARQLGPEQAAAIPRGHPREIDQPIDAATQANGSSHTHMVDQELG